MIWKAGEVLLAWNLNSPDFNAGSPPGSLAVGPLQSERDGDWTVGYSTTGGAAYISRRTMKKQEQEFAVLKDWYSIVYAYGLDPYLVHRAFLHIAEYQTVIRQMGWGPGKGELGHDPSITYGRCVDVVFPIKVMQRGPSYHYWTQEAFERHVRSEII